MKITIKIIVWLCTQESQLQLHKFILWQFTFIHVIQALFLLFYINNNIFMITSGNNQYLQCCNSVDQISYYRHNIDHKVRS